MISLYVYAIAGGLLSILGSLIWLGVAWWYYVLFVIALLVVGYYVVRKGYDKIAPQPVVGIPCPPLTHPVLGHPDLMMSPMKHSLRAAMCDAHKAPLHQLVLMKNNSVFIDDAKEAAKIIEKYDHKGPIYNAFRYDKDTPDMFASDGDDHELRFKKLKPTLHSMRLSSKTKEMIIDENLVSLLKKHVGSGADLDMKQASAFLAFDMICMEIFGYSLNAVLSDPESTEKSKGAELFQAIQSLLAAQAAGGLYADPTAKQVKPEEVVAARDIWKGFIGDLVAHLRSSPSSPYSQALLSMEKDSSWNFSDKNVLAEVSQTFRHGYESLSGLLSWTFYALSTNPEVRCDLEKAIMAHKATPSSPYPEYVEAVVKETLRKYPVCGNSTIRTVNGADVTVKGPDGQGGTHEYKIPNGTPISLHIWSLQNSKREWKDGEKYDPTRWLDKGWTDAAAEMDEGDREDSRSKAPKCPFLSSVQNKCSREDYEGLGHSQGSLSFFPFSAGKRSCPAKDFIVDSVCAIIMRVCSEFRLDCEQGLQPDPGISSSSIVIPAMTESTKLKISAEGLGVMPVKKKNDEWADDDDDDDEVPPLGEGDMLDTSP